MEYENNQIVSEPPKMDVGGLLIFYVGVGMLPPFKAEAYVERFNERFLADQKNWKRKLPENVGIFFIPVRPPAETRVDYIQFDHMTKEALDHLKEMREQWVEFMNNEMTPVCEVREERKSLWQRFIGMFS